MVENSLPEEAGHQDLLFPPVLPCAKETSLVQETGRSRDDGVIGAQRQDGGWSGALAATFAPLRSDLAMSGSRLLHAGAEAAFLFCAFRGGTLGGPGAFGSAASSGGAAALSLGRAFFQRL